MLTLLILFLRIYLFCEKKAPEFIRGEYVKLYKINQLYDKIICIFVYKLIIDKGSLEKSDK